MCGLNGESCYNISTDKIRISYINILFIYFLWNSFCNWFEKMKFGLILLFVFAIFQPALSQDNNPPSFTATGYIFTVSEDASVGTPLTGAPPIAAIDADGDSVTYKKSTNTDAPKISIDVSTGELSVASLLDRETTALYTLQIVADDGKENGQSLPVTVTIVVIDVNDNAPVFTNALSLFSVQEGVTNGYQVNPSGEPITVTDADIGNNQPSTFSIEDGDDDRFSIDPDGNIYTKLDFTVGVDQILDYETTPSYDLTVRATNTENDPNGMPVFTETHITILIIDINDEDPIFLASSIDQSITIAESATGSVFTIAAEDTDHPNIATTFKYTIAYGNEQISGMDSFSIDPTSGVISVAVTKLDHEVHPYYTLVLRAQEDQTPAASVVTTLAITITNENEFPPVFSMTTYTTSISENTLIGGVVLLVEATDDDSAHAISFSLDGSTDSQSFDISSSTGLLTTRLEFDREDQSSFSFEVIATDEADGLVTPLQSTATIIVSINDVNDNSPVFTYLRQTIELDETLATNVIVFDTTNDNPVIDIDVGVNMQVKYSLQTADTTFSMNEDTGELTLIAAFDYNVQSEYTLTILATDQALLVSERRSGSFVLTINVNDINNNPPVLDPIGAQSLEENLPSGSIVFTISATDLDEGLTVPLSFSIMEGNTVPFSIAITGTPTSTLATAQISTNEVLDFDSGTTVYVITIFVTDGTMTDSELVTITIVDVNDVAPVFTPSDYTFSVNEEEVSAIVGTVSATDADTIGGPITYTKSGDNDDNFIVDSSTGLITLAGALDAELFEVYRFSVVASDLGTPPISTLAKIVVTATDLNDNTPLFLIDDVSLSIEENTDYSNIFTFIASDADRTSPNNQFQFSITGSNPTSAAASFVISSDTGVLATSNPIDREEFSSITLEITVEDMGVLPLFSLASITITVNDQNDIGPTFDLPSYAMSIDEDFETGVEILQVNAMESNGDENTQITYSLDNTAGASGNPKQYINIDSISGSISASQSLDYETLSSLLLDVTASDGTFSDTVSLTITLNNVNDNTPILTTSSCSTTLPEDTPLGEFCSFSVSDADQDGTTMFELDLSGFSISPTTSIFDMTYLDGDTSASLILATALDFETTKTHTLTITLTDKGTSINTATISLTITVTGVNEFPPVFTTTVSFNMDESEETGYLIGLVTATDMDDPSTLDGMFTYSIPSQPATFAFKIDSTTGAISLQSKVNFEDNSAISFVVLATDLSISDTRTGTTTVSVMVSDTNENPPVFSTTFSGSVMEDAVISTFVLQIVATDADTGDVISYSIVNGNDAGSFIISATTGEISTNSVLDFETTQVFYLLVEATDGSTEPRITNTLATITVIDVNDNTPIFDRSPVDSSIYEEAANVFVMLVSATDLDSTSNADISYTVDATEFTMDATTGRLTTSTALDRESQSSYNIQICASDQGTTPSSTCVSVVVTLIDINDSPPEFDSASITMLTLAEDTGGMQVATFTVSDLDVAPQFFFTLADDGGPFSITSSGDTVMVNLSPTTRLDRELRDAYNLIITVNDGLTSVSHSFAILVDDVNDESPTFEKDTYVLTSEVLEDSVNGYIFFTIVATDNDVSPNNIITYSLLTTADDRFSIDSSTGEISVEKSSGSSIDFETDWSHEIMVQASDGTLAGIATVLILIGDVNDNPPIFLQPSYTINVSELVAIGTTILAVQANDADSGTNAQLFYAISSTDSDVLSTFELSRSTGILTTIDTLDADLPPTQYVFDISAEDSSLSPLTTLVSVMISIIGINEDTPVFSSSIYLATVSEQDSTIASLLTVLATEQDLTAVIVYSIPDFAKTYFEIDSNSGQLSLTASLDREEFETFTFSVIASDSETPPRQAVSTILITISDVDDNTPTFLLSDYSVSISESTAFNTVILTVKALDNDATIAFNTIAYSFLTATSLFSIDSTSGEVTVSGILDFDSGVDTFTLIVHAVDTANTGFADLVIQLIDENDNTPVITNTNFALSFPESSPAGTEIIDIDVTDVDTVGTLSFEIISGNSDNTFMIDSSGRITLAASGFDFESSKISFNLIVRVFDGLESVTETVMITVTDSNDNFPTFDLPSYSISLVESDMIDTSVIEFTVTDSDTGDNGIISLSIDPSSNTASMFKLTPATGTSANTVTGQILSNVALDRETSGIVIDQTTGAALWTLKVIATDNNAGASLRLTTTAEFEIAITDSNDNFPLFAPGPIVAQVSESSNIGTLVHTFSATDADFGTNADITFNFDAASLNTDKFSLDAFSGELRTTVVLSREDSTTLILIVEVSDGTLKNTATITITVEDINDHNPVFATTSLTLSLDENSLPDYTLTSIVVTDVDDGENGRVTLSIIGGDTGGHFKISSVTGVDLQVALDAIDRETISSYELILLAEDNGTPIRQGTATVTVTVSDLNDNAPIFSPTAYTGTIPEDAASGTTLDLNTPLSVIDIDQGVNSIFSLSLDDNSVFDISNTGNIFLNPSVSLDRELLASYTINIVAIDTGTPSQTSNAGIVITVEDVNDNPPIFFPLSYSLSVSENIAVGDIVTMVVATDIDEGANMQISYSLYSGSEGNFIVDRTSGEIELIGTLDRESTDIYQIIIAAFDSGSPFMSATAAVTITVLDFNDNTPIFSKSLYTGLVDENSASSIVNILVVDLDATDLDFGQNADLVFAFQDSVAGTSLPFSIDSSTGEITVIGLLDRETIDTYAFEVIVHDNPSTPGIPLTATANVIISINDINDVAPSFPGVTSFTTDIQETTFVTTTVLFPVATDPDLGDGGEIIYSADPVSTIFSVDPSTGVIRLIESLDLDSSGTNGLVTHTFNLVATDQGTPQLTGSIVVTITVLDENTNVPIFDFPPYTVGVLEDVIISTTIIQLTATDSDTNGVINYEIVGGNQDQFFDIDTTTGEVFTIASLLNAASTVFELTVNAFETGDPTKSSITSLHIEITDTNNNRPVFCQTANYKFSVPENSAVDTTVGQICGTDQDSGINGQFSFSIVSGNDDSAFTIVQVSGASIAYIVVANLVLDRENDAEYSLILMIRDNGTPEQTSDTIVAVITIDDVNDGTPIFTNLPNSVDIDEDVFGGTEIFLLQASDTDLTTNAEVIFQIIGGNTNAVFNLESVTGQITTVKPLDFNTLELYTLRIRVTDNGSPFLFSGSTLSVNIIDVNNNAPVFMPPYEASVQESVSINTFVILVQATDDDATTNAELVYTITSGINSLHFAIESTTGSISVNTADLDREVQSIYNLEVTACDMGTPVLCGSVGVTVIITDANDHPPIFNPAAYSFTILEDKNLLFIVGTVFAEDLDEGQNGIIEFLKIDSEPKFSISLDTGDVILEGELDRETVDFYQFMVLARDKGDPVMSDTAVINITVVDVNDNAPIIDTSIFSVQIAENTTVGQVIFDVDATDIDQGDHSKLIYYILGGDLGDFVINPTSGAITVNQPLDAESNSRYEILIQASDSAFPPLTDTDTLVITIIDINEQAPVFGQSVYTVDLLENAPAGTFLLNVTASDNDVADTKNSEISFFLTSGTDFVIDPLTGTILTTTSFDREISSTQTLIVKATNPNTIPLLEGSADIVVTIIDVNDQTPSFTNINLTQEISELSQIGFQLLTLTAEDKDDPSLENGRFVFSSAFENSEEFDRSFRINTDGIIEVNGPLDRELQDTYSPTAVVTDNGIPSLFSTTEFIITLSDENDIPPNLSSQLYSLTFPEDIDPSSQNGVPRLLDTLSYSDGDLDSKYKLSVFDIAIDSPFSFPDFNLTTQGDFFLNIGLDREIRDSYTLFVEVINTMPGHLLGSYCNPLNVNRARMIGNDCVLFGSSIIQLSVSDINDNDPSFVNPPYYFAILSSLSYNSDVDTILATDADLSEAGEVRYSLSGTDFTIDNTTGTLRTNAIFSGRVGDVISVVVTASDQEVATRRSATETVIISIVDNDYLLVIVVDDTVEKTQLCIDELVAKLIEITSFQIIIFEVTEQVIDTEVTDRTSVFFYAIDDINGTPTLVEQAELLRKIDDSFGDLSNLCDSKITMVSPVVETVNPILQSPSTNIQIILIMSFCVIIILCGCLANVLALYQRYVGKRSIKHSDDFVYGGMEGLDVLTSQRDMVLNQADIAPKPLPLVEEMTYESQELKMDLFMDEIPEDEFISGSERTSDMGGGSLLAAALDPSLDDNDDFYDDTSVSAI